MATKNPGLHHLGKEEPTADLGKEKYSSITDDTPSDSSGEHLRSQITF